MVARAEWPLRGITELGQACSNSYYTERWTRFYRIETRRVILSAKMGHAEKPSKVRGDNARMLESSANPLPTESYIALGIARRRWHGRGSRGSLNCTKLVMSALFMLAIKTDDGSSIPLNSPRPECSFRSRGER